MINDDTGVRRELRRVRPPRTTRGSRPRVFAGPAGRLAILAAAAGLGLAACSAAAGSSTPGVASLGTSSSPAAGGTANSGNATAGNSANAQSASGVTLLLNQWGACERSNGDPDQSDPTVTADGVINITIPKGAEVVGNVHEQTGTCSQYLAEAANDLRAANPVPPAPNQAALLKYVNCIRANGVPDYPYPTGGSTNFQGSGVDPYSPSVVRVSQLCGSKLGLPAWWVNGTDTPGSIEVHTAGSNPNAQPPACFYQKVDPCSGQHTPTGSGAGNGFGSGGGNGNGNGFGSGGGNGFG